MAATADGCAVCAEQDTTWQAYNTWGGVCLYGGFGSRWCEDGAPRSYVASYNRPMVTRDYRAINAPFGAPCSPPNIHAVFWRQTALTRSRVLCPQG